MKTTRYLCLGVVMTFAATGLATAKGLSWRFEYGDRDLVTRSIDPANRITRFSYEGPTNGPIRSVTMTPPEGKPVSWLFDDASRLQRMNDGEGAVEYGYDARNRLKSVGRAGGPLISLDYDVSDHLTQLRVGDFYRVDYEYDFLGRLARMNTPAGQVRYEYWTGQGMVVRILPNGVKTFWKRQLNGELEEITHGLFKKPGDKQYSVLAEYAYTHGADGRIAGIREKGEQGTFSRQYQYDKMGHLTDMTGPAGREFHCKYDPMGNRTSAAASGRPEQVCAYDWAGRLTSVDGKPCQYDACGNLAEVTIGGAARQFGYHPDGRLAEARANNETVQYRYDGAGRLVVRKNAKQETRFVPDPLSDCWQPLVIEEAAGGRTLVIWDGTSPLALIRNKQVEWLLHDHLGSVRLVTDAKGVVTRQCEYDPFGQWSGAKGEMTLTLGYAGLFWDGDACAYLTAARAFSPGFGGFMQPDPVKSVPTEGTQVSSLYAYCGSDPVNWVDRNGADRAQAERELLDIEARIRELVRDQVRKDFPNNEGDTGYLKCYEWQERVYAMLKKQKYKEWKVIPYAEKGNLFDRAAYFLGSGLKTGKFDGSVFNLKDTHYWKHFLVGVKSLSDKRQVYKVDPWRDLFDPSRFLWNLEYRYGKAGKPERFYPSEKRYDEGELRMGDFVPKVQPRPQIRSLARPSPVGGVYLGGAGGTIEGLGNVKGVRLDGNGNLVLVGESGGDVKLPPLRVDDVVTVFRSVYLNGEGPTVTIDPNPADPEKLPMMIVHSEATKDTYVGWVLYEADRLMKGYTLGKDNLTKKDVTSQVEGYSKVLDTMYFGGKVSSGSQVESGWEDYWIYYGSDVHLDREKGGTWERFWIVPAEANRYEGPGKELTLFDIPLKVKTQKMKWEKKKLVDDLKGKSSPGADAFTTWFTRNYDGIAAEQYLMPPAESGMSQPVPVFAELRRIALMTAIAEKLRDQGEPLPFWMRDYEVRKVPFEHETPGMEVSKEKEEGKMIRTARIYGGVELSPDSKAVKTYATAADVAKTPPARRVEVEREVKVARDLEKVVVEAPRVELAKPLTVQQVASSGVDYQTVAVPSAKTVALNPVQLEETDVVAALPGGREIRLARSFNSFFDPKGEWGRGWTMNLPKLQAVRVATSREGGKVLYATCYELVSPLNSVYARFKDVRPVAELSGAKLQVPDKDGLFYGLGDTHPKFLGKTPTRVLFLKDGREWHFAESGELVAIQEGPQVTIYTRHGDGRVTQVVGMLGGTPQARIDLEYNSDGALSKATAVSLGEGAAKPEEVSYGYGASGRLAEVRSSEGTVSYGYKGSWVTTVSFANKNEGGAPELLRSIEYNERGQVVSDRTGKGGVTHAVTVVAGGIEASVSDVQDGTKSSTRYDHRMRPVDATEPDGTHTQWAYAPAGGVEMTVTAPDTKPLKVVDSTDGRERTITQEGAPPTTARFDAGGRLTSLAEDGKPVLTQAWRSDGQLARLESGTQAVSVRYDKDEMLSSLLAHPAQAGDKFSEWQETKLDRQGRPLEVTDCNGLQVTFGYDQSGALSSVAQKTSDGKRGYTLNRDAKGQVQSLKSPWGNTDYKYDPEGAIRQVVSTRGNQSATTEFKQGRASVATGFDGGRTIMNYLENGPASGMLQSLTCPNGLKLDYSYNADAGLSTVKIGTGSQIRLEHDAKGRVTEFALEPAIN